MGMFRKVMLFVSAMALAGCTLSDGSNLVIGTPRAPTNPADVKIYTVLPAHYEKIAIVSAESRNDFASQQNLTDHAIEQLKKEAAKVGANGILLNGFGNYQVGSNGAIVIPRTGGAPGLGYAATTASMGMQASGVAIYVPSKAPEK